MAARADPATHDREPRSLTARVLAPLALVACTAALISVVATALSGEGDGDRGERQGNQRQERQRDKPEVQGKTYVVQPGDTLTAVSEKSGIPIGRLQRFNPDIDPQTLNAGQVIKLRR